MVLLIATATATFVTTRGGAEFQTPGVPIFYGGTSAMAFRDMNALKYQSVVQWDPNLRIADGSDTGSPIAPGDEIMQIVDNMGIPMYPEDGRIPLENVQYIPGFGLAVARAYIKEIAQ